MSETAPAVAPSFSLGVGQLTAAVASAAVALCLLALGLAGSSFARFVIEMVLINAIATMGVNIGMGFAGLVSIGHAGFAAIGAYTCTLLMLHWDVPYLFALPAGALAAALAGVAIGIPALRLSPLYIAMVTFGFGQAVNLLVINWIELTRGPNGMAVPEITVLGEVASSRDVFILVAVLFAALFWLSWNIRRTRLGRAFLAVRDSTIAAQSMGIPVARYKTIAFALSAFYGGLAGGLYAEVSGFINPGAFTFGVSISYVTMCVVGGFGTLIGPFIGALLLTLLPEFLRSFAEYKEFLTGIILLAFMVLLPSGLVGLTRRLAAALRRWAA
jgi:ABC-type branched-subunit amino acid transport system permease subunit